MESVKASALDKAAERVSVSDRIEELTLVDAWIVLWRRKILIGAITLGFAIASVIVALILTPIFKAEVLAAPNPVTAKVGQGMSAAGASVLSDISSLSGSNASMPVSPTNIAIAVLESREFADRFIRSQKMLPILFPDTPMSGPDAPTMWDAFKVFDKIREVSIDKDTGLVTLAIYWKDPSLAAQWANGMMSRVNQEMRDRSVTASQKNLAYLNSQLQIENRTEVRSTLAGLIEQVINDVMVASSQSEYAFTIIDPAVVPKDKDSPKRAYIVLGATFGGLLIGMFTAFVLNFRDGLI